MSRFKDFFYYISPSFYYFMNTCYEIFSAIGGVKLRKFSDLHLNIKFSVLFLEDNGKSYQDYREKWQTSQPFFCDE